MDETKKAKTQKIAIAILLVNFAGILIYTLKGTFSKPVSPEATIAKGDFNVKDAKVALTNFAKEKVLYQGDPYRDPLKKPLEITMLEGEGASSVKVPKEITGTATLKGELVLEGVIWGGAQNLAIISGEVVSEGETIGSAKVLSIGENRVTIIKGGKEIELTR